MRSSSSMKVSLHGGVFQVRPISGPVDPVSEVHSVCNNSDSSSRFRLGSRAIAIAYNVEWSTLIRENEGK